MCSPDQAGRSPPEEGRDPQPRKRDQGWAEHPDHVQCKRQPWMIGGEKSSDCPGLGHWLEQFHQDQSTTSLVHHRHFLIEQQERIVPAVLSTGVG